MTHLIKQRATELLITLLSFVICLAYFSLVTDDYGAFSYFNLPAGQFSNYPQTEYYYLGMIGLSDGYNFLYTHFPAFNWVGISFIGFAFFSMYLLLRSIKKVALPHLQGMGIITVVQLLFALFFTENIISMSHTRFSLLLCGLGLFNLLFANTVTRKGIAINTAIFVLGILIRPESGLGMVLLVSAGYLIYSFRIKHLVQRIFFPALVTLSLFTVFAIDWSNTDMYVKKVEPEIEYKIMDKRMVPLSSMKTAADSVKYEAAKVGMWFDMRTLTPEYMRSLLLPGINLSPKHAGKVFFHSLSFYKHYVFIPSAVFVLLVLCVFMPGYRKVMLQIKLFQIAAFLVIYAVDYNGRLVGERHFLNLQLIGLLITLHYLFGSITAEDWRRLSKPLQAICLLAVLGSTVPTILNYKANNDRMAADIKCYESAMQEIENTFTNRLVVANLSNVYLLNRSFSIYTDNYVKNKYIMFDVFTYSLAPGYINYLANQCHCDPVNPVAFYQWLLDSKALYISEPGRYDLTERYMDIIHHQKFKFILPANFKKPDCMQGTEMEEYEVREITNNSEPVTNIN